MEPWLYPVIVIAGFFAGVINTLAGSGSLITLPLLIFVGLPANVANGTNRIAILLQNAVGLSSFRKSGVLDWERGRWLALPALVGGLLGAQIAVEMNERVMRSLIALVLIVMFIVILIKPKRWLRGDQKVKTGKPSWREYAVFFAIGIYGGLIQAGVGIFLLAGLVLMSGYDLVRANAVKVLIILGFTAVALIVFVINDQVNWSIGLLLASGNMLGAWVGARAAVKQGAGFVRWILILAVGAAAAKMAFDVIAGL